MKTTTDKILHEINEKYYIEYVDGKVEKIALASQPTTEDLLKKMVEKDHNVLTSQEESQEGNKMNITLRNVRFTSYDPATDIETDVRPLTMKEARDFWDLVNEASGDDFPGEVEEFADKRTSGQANDVQWDTTYQES